MVTPVFGEVKNVRNIPGCADKYNEIQGFVKECIDKSEYENPSIVTDDIMKGGLQYMTTEVINGVPTDIYATDKLSCMGDSGAIFVLEVSEDDVRCRIDTEDTWERLDKARPKNTKECLDDCSVNEDTDSGIHV